MSDGAGVALKSDQNKTITLLFRDPDTLRLVDTNGDEFKTKLNDDRKRDALYPPIAAAD